MTVGPADDSRAGKLPEWAEELRALGAQDDETLAALAGAFGEWARAVALRPDERRLLWDRIVDAGPVPIDDEAETA